MGTRPLRGLVTVGPFSPKVLRKQAPSGCATGKRVHKTEAKALAALREVRARRTVLGETREHENNIYPCRQCGGWHLSSNGPLIAADYIPDRERGDGETWEAYAGRLERRIKEQRAQILSLHALGHGGNSRQARKRIQNLTVALSRVTELWQEEVRNREALVARLNERRWWRRARIARAEADRGGERSC